MLGSRHQKHWFSAKDGESNQKNKLKCSKIQQNRGAISRSGWMKIRNGKKYPEQLCEISRTSCNWLWKKWMGGHGISAAQNRATSLEKCYRSFHNTHLFIVPTITQKQLTSIFGFKLQQACKAIKKYGNCNLASMNIAAMNQNIHHMVLPWIIEEELEENQGRGDICIRTTGLWEGTTDTWKYVDGHEKKQRWTTDGAFWVIPAVWATNDSMGPNKRGRSSGARNAKIILATSR
jgi:hypothetical protein